MPKGPETGSYSVPKVAGGAGYAQVPPASLGARGDRPTPGSPANPGTQGYKGPAEAPVYSKSTANISKLGPNS